MIELLKKYFGHNEFRPMQLDIIDNVLKKRDSLVIMPTGGGKSICYQLPTLQFEGLTIVISPLISLMKDQVDSLMANGINAEYINSSLSFEEILLIQNKIQRKEIRLLYIAPERLALEEFRVFLSTLQVSLIAIDEAHCISEWEHDFRPEYRNLKSLRILFPDAPIIALTATATEKVRIDILRQLSLREPRIFISSFNRKNLNLMVVEKKKTIERIITMLKEYKDESAII
jgi:ATP-dependent DNA helicase RecQ